MLKFLHLHVHQSTGTAALTCVVLTCGLAVLCLFTLQGAETVIYAASSPELGLGLPQPLFLHDCKPKEPLVSA